MLEYPIILSVSVFISSCFIGYWLGYICSKIYYNE